MKSSTTGTRWISPLAYLVAVLLAAAAATAVEPRVLRKEVVVEASLDEVWSAWTTEEGLKFASTKSRVELRVGGPYEWFLQGEADERGRRGGEGARILAFLPHEMLAFDWTFPPDIPSLRYSDAKTQVVLLFDRVGETRVRLRFAQLGWEDGEDWEAGYRYFDEAWGWVLGQLEAHFEEAAPPPAAAEDEPPEPPSLLGPVSREEIEQAQPDWVAAQPEYETDPESVSALAGVEPGATVQVYFGTWCSDSRRELARFWRALDENFGVVPFEVEYIAVDRSDKRPPELSEELDLRFVPTFIVLREGREVGRMVEVSPNGIERDLLALLTGEAEGVVSAREDLDASPEAAAPPLD